MRRNPSKPRRLFPSIHPRLDRLEDRTTPAAFVVTGAGDTIATDGVITLREAITAANTNAASGDAPAGAAGLDTITFSPALTGRIITLTSALPAISEALTIMGLGANKLTINANATGRVFANNAGVTATISSLTVTGGLVTSGGGGGILNNGNLTLSGVTVTNNTARGVSGGGVLTTGAGAQLTMSGCTDSANLSVFGAGVDIANGSAAISGSAISNNVASGSGGGIRVESSATLTVTGSTIANNNAIGNGINGGGISNAGTLSVDSCAVFGNTCSIECGGIFSGQNTTATATIRNTTIANNSAQDVGGLLIRNGSGVVNNCTITGNFTASSGFGNEAGGLSFGGTTLTMNNTIVALNSFGAPGPPPDIRGAITSGLNNFIGIGDATLTGITNGANGNKVGTSAAPLDPLLGPLQINSGPTLTRLPRPGSPVINAGTNSTLAGLLVDQRGQPRVVGGAVDIGAAESQLLTLDLYAVGAGAGGGPEVKVFEADGTLRFDFNAYAVNFTGGVRVATGDVNGDGVDDIITAAGAGGGPHVRVFDGTTGTELGSFFAFLPTFVGGVYVATGDANGDGKSDIIVGSGSGLIATVEVIDATKLNQVQANGQIANTALLLRLSPYGSFTGGVTVAGGDVNGDGKADVITGAGAGGGPHVQAFSGANGQSLASFFAFAGNFSGGVFVASADENGDGRADIIVGAGAGGQPQVKVFDGSNVNTVLTSFLAYSANFTGGVRVSAFDINGDGRAEIVTGAGTGGGPHVRLIDDVSLVAQREFFAYDSAFLGGVFVG
jgi:hypothetical protein